MESGPALLGAGGPAWVYLSFPSGSPDPGQQHPLTPREPDVCCWGWGQPWASPGHAGGPSLRAGFRREIYFCLHGPTGPSVSIKGPESRPGQLAVSSYCYSLPKQRPLQWGHKVQAAQPQGRRAQMPRRAPCTTAPPPGSQGQQEASSAPQRSAGRRGCGSLEFCRAGPQVLPACCAQAGPQGASRVGPWTGCETRGPRRGTWPERVWSLR